VHVALCPRRKDRPLGERRAQRHVHHRLRVHCPAVGVQDGTEVAPTELQPGHRHGRTADAEHEAHDTERHPDAQAEERLEQRTQGGRDAAHSDTERGDRPHVEAPRARWCRAGSGGRRGCRRRTRGGHHGGVVDAGREGGVLRGGFVGGAARDALLHHADDLLVGSPEGLSDTDGVLDHLRDRGIPVHPLAVVEDAVAAHHEVVGVARGHGCGDVHGVALGVLQRAVEQVAVGERRHGGMLGRVLHLDAQLAGARVQVERADLEHGGRPARVEVAEGHEVVHQAHQVTVEAHQLLDRLDGLRLRFLLLVLGDELEELLLVVALGELTHACGAQLLHEDARLSGPPRLVCRQLRLDAGEVGLAESVLLAHQRLHDGALERGHAHAPGRVEPLRQRQPLVHHDLGQWELLHLGRGHVQVLGRELEVGLLLTVHGQQRARVIGSDLHAREVVGDLRADRLVGGVGGLGRVPQRTDGLRLALLQPLGVRPNLLEERDDSGLGGARLAALVLVRRRGAREHVGKGGLQRLVLDGRRHQHAIAVERVFVEGAAGLAGVFHRERRGRVFAECLQDGLRGLEQELALVVLLVDGRQLQLARALHQDVGVPEDGPQPLHRGEQLGRPDALVLVRVQQLQGALVELDAGGGTRQRHPELLIQLRERHEVCSRRDLDLIESPGAHELEAVSHEDAFSPMWGCAASGLASSSPPYRAGRG
jgi:hypothetical protein